MRTARPAAAWRAIVSYTSALLPMSMPRLGARAHAQLTDPVASALGLTSEVEDAGARALRARRAQVVGDRERKRESFTLAILAHVTDALAHARGRGSVPCRASRPVQFDGAAGWRVE